MLYKVYGRGLRDEFDIKGTIVPEGSHYCFIEADITSITQNGDLLFLKEFIDDKGEKDKKLILALASCEWRVVYECDKERKLMNVGV